MCELVFVLARLVLEAGHRCSVPEAFHNLISVSGSARFFKRSRSLRRHFRTVAAAKGLRLDAVSSKMKSLNSLEVTAVYHTAFGVYGILIKAGELAVIKKNGGPYKNRYDLPGGSLEEGETLSAALHREFKEETGLTATAVKQLGTINFLYPWSYQDTTMNNHICVFYEITKAVGAVAKTLPQFSGQDSLGALFVSFEKLTEKNASPLVLAAKEFYLQHSFAAVEQRFSTWEVLQAPVFREDE